MIIYSQFNYLTAFDLGYNDENVAIVNTGHIDREKLDVFRNELLKDPTIESVTADEGGRMGTMAHINDGKEMNFDIKYVDENYFPLFKIPVGSTATQDALADLIAPASANNKAMYKYVYNQFCNRATFHY